MNDNTGWAGIRQLLAVAVSISFFFSVFVPVNLYLNNMQDFLHVSFVALLVASLVAFIIGTVLLLTLMLIIRSNRRLLRGMLALGCGIVMALYIQGNLINLDYGILDGHVIAWDQMVGRGIMNTCVWALVVTLFFIAGLKIRHSIAILKTVMVVWMCYLALIIVLKVSTTPVLSKCPAVFTYDGFDVVSSQRNILVFILDSFDQSLMNEVLKKKPEYYEKFSDFVFYQNTIGRFSYTFFALPHILTGCPSEKKVDEGADLYSAYKDEAYRKAELYPAAVANDFLTYIYTSATHAPSREVAGKLGVRNLVWREVCAKDAVNFWIETFNASTFLYLPHFLKRFSEQLAISKMTTDDKSLPSISMLDAERRFEALVRDKAFIRSERKLLKFYHLFGPHLPEFNINKAERCLDYMLRFVEELKRLKVYEQTSIFIMADHGVLDRAHPLFMTNGGRGPLRVVKKPFSYDDFDSCLLRTLETGEINVPEAKGERGYVFADKRMFCTNHYDETGILICRRRGNARKFDGTAPLPSSGFEWDFSGQSKSVWTIGKHAYVDVPLEAKDVGKPFSVEVVASALLGGNVATQKVCYSINGKMQKDVLYTTEHNQQKVCLQLDAGANSKAQIRIGVDVDNPVVPARVFKGSGDPRPLGVSISSIELKPHAEQMISFGIERIRNDTLVSGFSSVEPPYGCWNDGFSSTASLRIPPDMKGKVVLMTLSHHLFLPKGKIAAQRVKVEADGVKLIDDKLSKPGVQEMKLKLTPEMTKDGVVELKFTLPDAASPSELGVGNDPRKLAIFLRSCKMEIAE